MPIDTTPTERTPTQEDNMPPSRNLYCDYCSIYVSADLITECSTCANYHCGDCSHVHDGDYCDNCGFATLTDMETRVCEEDGLRYCLDAHQWAHRRCSQGRQPQVDGMGREATLDYMDDEYIVDPLAKGKRSAAVELELEWIGPTNVSTFTLPYEFGIELDGSLSNGIEVTTPPAKGRALVDFMKTACAALTDAGYQPRASCGMHVHIDLRDKIEDKRFLSHLFNAAYAFEDVLYAMQKHGRYSGSYSVPLRNKYKFFDMYGQRSGDFDFTFYGYSKNHDNMRYMNNEKARKYANPRYAAFNFHSVYYRGSLECRINGGENVAECALKWVDLIQAIIARVEEGHSYSFMTKWAKVGVTEEKVRAMARYFKLDADMVAYITDRIENGQGWNFKLPGPVRWGVPIKGRPKGDPRPAARRLHRTEFVGRRVEHNYCGGQFVLRARMEYCPICTRSLVDVYGERRYNFAVRRRRSRTARRDSMFGAYR